MTSFLARSEHLERVGSTNDVVRAWLSDGVPEVCLAVADEQTGGRGREGRRWVGPGGAALLLSLGFRPTWLEPDRTWRLAAVTSLAMADAAEAVAGLPAETIRLKWPNDLVIEMDAAGTALSGTTALAATLAATPALAGATAAVPPEVRKVAGVLGETDGLGSADPRVVVGIGVNANWPAPDFPADLARAMTSLHQASGGRSVDTPRLLETFLGRLEARVEALRAGRFDADGWARRQITTGRTIRLETPRGDEIVQAVGVDTSNGALIVIDPNAVLGARRVLVGEITHIRLAVPSAATV